MKTKETTKKLGHGALKGVVVGGAVLNATLGTLTNPFVRDEKKRSPSERWHKTMCEFDFDLSKEVRECPNCTQDIYTRMGRKGETVGLWLGGSKVLDVATHSVLRNLAEETGGRAFFPGKVEDLAEVYQQIAEELRSQYGDNARVEWLGRVSDDPKVVDVLLENLQHDDNPLFRDKAACALAYDQIHLTPAQKVRLYEGLIAALADPKDDVRHIAALALQIHTGQTKGYAAGAPDPARAAAIAEWDAWLARYRENLR